MMKDELKEYLKRTALFDYYLSSKNKKALKKWLDDGKPVPPPHIVKVNAVKEYAHDFSIGTMVETGTYLGDMVNAVRKDFKRIYSIELNEKLAKDAQKKFEPYPHINIIQGDSAKKLPTILKEIEGSCLFWLDGHYSGGITSKGDVDTPIMKELEYIMDSDLSSYVLLIDDARLFVGKNDYPTVAFLKDLFKTRFPDWTFKVQDDIIRIHAPKKKPSKKSKD